MADEGRVERRLLVSVDARGYGSAPDGRHGEIQQGLLDVMDAAARETGLKRDTWDRQPGGDGELAVLPLEEPEVRVVERFPRELHYALLRHNRNLNDAARLRLRLAVHFGTATPGPNGYAHAGPVVVSRLCDSDALRDALQSTGADLAVIFSRQIFHDTVQSGLTLLDPGQLRHVRVAKKEFDEDAWIWVPGRAVDGGSAPGEVGGPPRSEASPGLQGATDDAVADSFAEAAQRQRRKKAARGDGLHVGAWHEGRGNDAGGGTSGAESEDAQGFDELLRRKQQFDSFGPHRGAPPRTDDPFDRTVLPASEPDGPGDQDDPEPPK